MSGAGLGASLVSPPGLKLGGKLRVLFCAMLVLTGRSFSAVVLCKIGVRGLCEIG